MPPRAPSLPWLHADPQRAQLLLVALRALAAYAAAPWNGWAIDDAVIVAHPLLQSFRTLPEAMMSPVSLDLNPRARRARTRLASVLGA